MRADKKIYLVKPGEEEFDPTTGDWVIGDGAKIEKYANVTDTGIQRMNVLYNGIKQTAKTVRLNEVHTDSFDHILMDGKQYRVDMRRTYRHKTVFEVSGVQ